MLQALPKAKAILGDRGYDADWFRAALIAKGIAPCIPSKANRKVLIPHDQTPTASATASRTCSASFWTGAASTPALIDARTLSSQPSRSLLSSSSGCNQ